MTDKENLIISKKLKKDEKLLWSGKPNSSSYINFKNFKKNVSIAVIIIILLSLSTILYTSFLLTMAKSSNLNLFNNKIFLIFTIFSLLILLVVLYKIFNSSSISFYFKSCKILYVITNKRIFLINYKKKIYTKEFSKDSINKYTISYTPKGLGNIIFNNNNNEKNYFETGFINIENFKKIEIIIVENFIKKN